MYAHSHTQSHTYTLLGLFSWMDKGNFWQIEGKGYSLGHLGARVLHCFPDPLLAWTFYCSSDSLSTELQGHCIAREMSTHSPLSVYHLLYSILIPQHPVPLASMNPNHSHQHPQHPRASPVTSFSPHLKDCPLYSRSQKSRSSIGNPVYVRCVDSSTLVLVFHHTDTHL